MGLPEPVLKVLLYSGAPFFAWPFKPTLNALEGESYARAYTHFRRDHQSPANLVYHCFCLVLQLGMNYSLLAEVGKKLAEATGGGQRVADLVPLTTSAAWSWSLLRAHDAPIVVRLASLGAIAAAHASREVMSPMWQKVTYATGVLEMVAIQVFLINKVANTSGKGKVPMNKKQLLMLCLGRWGLQTLVEKKVEGCCAGSTGRKVVNALVAAFMLKVTQDPFAASSGGKATRTPFLLGFVGWILAMMTSQPWLYFYSGGFLASLAQGVSHHYADEEGTLPQLASASDELAHTTFFPNLLLHSVYQTLRSGRGEAALAD